MPTQTIESAKTAAPSRSSFRLELQGLRALAVGLVLLYHLWPERLSGGFVGVDVFFVVSGFLITGHLYRELSSTGTIMLGKFWARRVMRLLPLAFTVLVFSFVAMLLIVPQTVWGMNVRQILGSLFYVENWVLAADSVDYMAADNEPSLVQHYWSLSIEEQFYIMLPLILLGSYLLTKFVRKDKHREPLNTHKVFVWVLLVITILAFIFSVSYTSYDAAQAYFVTPTRFWEFSIGGLLAMMPSATKLPRRAQNLLGWAGVIGIVIAAVVYSGDTAFPGYTALLPVIGAALFIRYGSHDRVSGIYWWASLKPSTRMGDWSYAIYLWHWPLIILASYHLDPFLWPHKLGLILITLMLSAVSQKLIEDPLRRARPFKVPARAFTLMASNMAIIAAVIVLLPQTLSPNTSDEVTIQECTGANVFLNNCEDKGLEGEPSISATQVHAEGEEHTYPECFIPQGKTDFDRSNCSLGADPATADYTIAVFGSSHARMWLPMFDDLGKEMNWNIQGYAKSACSPIPLPTTAPDASGSTRERSEGCDEFVIETAEKLKNDPDIDAIATGSLGGTEKHYMEDGETATDSEKVEAIDQMWQDWADADKDVVVIAEVPYFNEIEAPTCITENENEIVENCSVSYEDAVESPTRFQRLTASEGTADMSYYDPAKGICDTNRCYSMVGGLVTRYDATHFSSDFARSYTPDFANFMREEVLD